MPSVRLRWADNSTNEDSFVVERRLEGGNFTQLVTLGAGVVSYTDSTVQAGRNYSYRVKAKNGSFSSLYSNTVTISVSGGSAPPPSTPSGVGDWYVSKTGSDSNPGNSIDLPFLNVLTAVRASSPGETIIIRGGEYAEYFDNEDFGGGSSWSEKLRIAAYPGETVWLNPPEGTGFVLYIPGDRYNQTYVEFDGINLDASRCLYGAIKTEANRDLTTETHHLRFMNLEITATSTEVNVLVSMQSTSSSGTVEATGGHEFLNVRATGAYYNETHGLPGEAFYIACSNVLLDGCEVNGIYGNAFQIYNHNDADVTGVIVRNCKFHDLNNYTPGDPSKRIIAGTAYSAHAHDNDVYNNVFWNIGGGGAVNVAGFTMGGGAYDNRCYNNTFYNVLGNGISLDDDAGSGNEVRNCIAYSCTTNFYNSGLGSASNNLTDGTNPMFVNAAGGDFHLQEGSPCIDTGTTLATVTTDIEGRARPKGSAYDMGAYEYFTAIYVSTTGNDTTGTGSFGNPYRTVNRGIADLSAGQELLIRGGSYAEMIESCPSGTSWDNKVRIAAYPSETVWLNPVSTTTHGVIQLHDGESYIEFDGINADSTQKIGRPIGFGRGEGNPLPHHIRYMNAEVIGNGIDAYPTDHVAMGAHEVQNAQGGFEILNVVIHGGSSYGIYIASPNCLIDGCYIYDFGTYGIHIWNEGGDPANNNIIRNCTIAGPAKPGLFYGLDPNPGLGGILISRDGNQVYNNVIFGLNDGWSTDAGNAAIIVYNGASNTDVYHNTLVANGGCWGVKVVDWGGGQQNTKIRNNISWQNDYGDFSDAPTATGTVIDHNLTGVDPLFVNAGARNYRLQAGSPAIDAGAAGLIATDADGVSRPLGSAPDCGAYESF